MSNGETYYIMVRSSDSGPGVDFNLCVVQLPPAASNNDCSSPIVLTESTDASGNNAISGDFANVYPSPEACDIGANTLWYSFTPNSTGLYNFNLTQNDFSVNYSVFNTDDCSLTEFNFVLNSFCYYGGGVLSTELVAGNTYLISVYAFSSNLNPFNLLVYPDASLSAESTDFESFNYYPNPVISTFTVSAKNVITNISVYNLIGQEVKMITPNTTEAIINMEEFDNGVYFVSLTVNDSQKTIKVIKK
jgi:hypothetical protein